MARFLIVDDDHVAVRALTLLLMSDGHYVVPATTGADAIETLTRESFDAVLTDLDMPGTDGYAVVRAAREHVPGACVVVISATGRGVEQHLAQAGACGMVDKPMDFEHVTRVVAECRRPGGPRSSGECHLKSMAPEPLVPLRRR
jgi:CheY-like chemotaxis protein